MPVPDSIDRFVLQRYLSDHLTGATAGLGRFQRMAKAYGDSEIGAEITQLAEEIQEDHDHAQQLIGRLGLNQPRIMRALAGAAEVVGRLKPNGRGPFASPMTPLLELELLRGAVNAKQGLWETLEHYADELGLDPAEYRRRVHNAEDQFSRLKELHARLVPDALRPGQAGVL
ncbi:hypothetical protein [Propioniciclava soli]|uniref:Ferritin-like domain-containing protein n=1 Tax=Propioniciclava soli TaxID=2775081 RepID=A0ABZ3C912_9ACTN|nr:hypothetical protein [Propioniciclava soli]